MSNTELDAAGFPWDERIHLKDHSKEENGTWQIRKNVTKTFVTEVQLGVPAATPAPEPTISYGEAVGILRKANIPYDTKLSKAEIISLAEAVPPEKYFRIVIQENEESTVQAFVKVNGTSFRMTRGVELVVPERVVKAMLNGVIYQAYQNEDNPKDTTIYYRRKQTEMFSVLGEAPAP